MASAHKTFFFSGVGGSGMSALALALVAEGHVVKGSDRSHDKAETPEKFQTLAKAGIQLYPQDGSGLDASVDTLVVSSAVEESTPDVRAARTLNINIKKRAEILASLLRAKRGIAVGGTSGKSTTTAMLGHILNYNGFDSTVINGAVMMNALEEKAKGLGNAVIGRGNMIVIEADESDGSIALYEDDLWIAVLTNITLDHKPVDQLRPLFENFVRKAQEGAIVNLDDPEARQMAALNPKRTFTFSLKDKTATLYTAKISYTDTGSVFHVQDSDAGEAVDVSLKVPGQHNVENALAAMAAARMAGVSVSESAEALRDFKGIKRRLEVIGREKGITVIDDFAHNPDKIAASLEALRHAPGRLIIIFQPHGFGPMKMMGREIAEAFAKGMVSDDILLVTDIYYAGGTTQKDISSADLVQQVVDDGRMAMHLPTRDLIRDFLKENVKSGDRIVVMGARDDTLTGFCKDILADIGT